jgi:hypothetical protein
MFLTGVIEGFYGRAWSAAQRGEMLDWIVAAEMNAFVYGPKDDVKVRARWRELYSNAELEAIGVLGDAARARDIRFFVAIAPSLDVTYSDPADLSALQARIRQLVGRGIVHFVLLFDDIPREMNQADQASFTSLAAAQAQFSNDTFAGLRALVPEAELIFCPTEYCGAFARPDVARSGYLWDLGQLLDPQIKVFWTGPDIVSEEIDAASLRQIGAILNRKPVIWENFHANDYDIRRVYAGPLGGRGDDILSLIDGIITNPNNEFEANFVAVHSTGAWARGGYDEGAALEAAISAWQPRFKLAYTEPERHVGREQIRLLTEICYQPFTCGPEIERLLGVARSLLGVHRPEITPAWRAGCAEIVGLRDEIRALFDVMTELENRDLFYAFHPYLWEAREEVTHLCSYLEWLSDGPASEAEFPDRERIYNFYRRGFTVAVQELLKRDGEGRYHHAD